MCELCEYVWILYPYTDLTNASVVPGCIFQHKMRSLPRCTPQKYTHCHTSVYVMGVHCRITILWAGLLSEAV